MVEGPFGDRVTEQHAGQESSRLTGDRLELGVQKPTAGLEDAADLLHRSSAVLRGKVVQGEGAGAVLGGHQNSAARCPGSATIRVAGQMWASRPRAIRTARFVAST